MRNNQVKIYTDGACSGNPGPGGYGILIHSQNAYMEISGSEVNTTNNKMELKAAIIALRQLTSPASVKLYSDSKYLIHGITTWMKGWEKNGWRTAARKPVENQVLWRMLKTLDATHTVEWIWVKGHNENAGNERCDALARAAIRTLLRACPSI